MNKKERLKYRNQRRKKEMKELKEIFKSGTPRR